MFFEITPDVVPSTVEPLKKTLTAWYPVPLRQYRKDEADASCVRPPRRAVSHVPPGISVVRKVSGRAKAGWGVLCDCACIARSQALIYRQTPGRYRDLGSGCKSPELCVDVVSDVDIKAKSSLAGFLWPGSHTWGLTVPGKASGNAALSFVC